MRCKGTIYFLEQRTKNKEILVHSHLYWFISRQVYNKPTLPENGLSRDSFSAFLPHITRNYFSKGKKTGSTNVSETFTQRGYKSIIKSISKIYHNVSSTTSSTFSPRSLEFVNSHYLCVLRVRLASVSHHLSSRCGFNPHRQNISEIRNGISWVFLWKS